MFGIKRPANSGKEQCVHEKALPRWDKVEDAGNLERVSGYYCPTCDQFLAPDPPRRGAGAAAGAANPG